MIIKIGRLTAALMLVVVGVALLIDRWQGTAYLGLLLEWWPIILVLLGLEYLYYGTRNLGEGVRTQLDIASVIGAVVLSAVIGTAASWQSIWHWDVWNGKSVQLNVPLSEIIDSTANARKVDKDVIHVEVPQGNAKVWLRNVNGDITVRSSDTEDIQIGMKISASGVSDQEALEIAEKTTLQVSGERTLTMNVKGYRYGKGSHREPRVDLEVFIPKGHSASWEFETKNGDLDIDGIAGSAKIETINGDISVRSVQGEIDARTTLGDINIQDAKGKLQAKTTNGDIDVSSSEIGGDWNLGTTLGDVSATIPSSGDYVLRGKTTLGEVNARSDDDSAMDGFSVQNRSIEGTRGSGTYRIEAGTQGDFNVTFR